MIGSAFGASGVRPASYRLVLPEGWHRLDIRSPVAESDLRVWVIELLGSQPQGSRVPPSLIDGMARDLHADILRARRHAALELYLSFMSAPPLTVPASLLVSMIPCRGEGIAIDVLASQLAAPFEDAGAETERERRSVTIVELGVGRVVRRRTAWRQLSPEGGAIEGFSLDFHVPVPQANGVLLVLSFACPIVVLEPVMSELFDMVALSLQWTS